jgi:amino acid transporter
VTAFSFAELSSRLPKSAGEAAYVSAAFGRPRLALAVGWAVAAVAVVSASTMVRGFVGYLGVFVDLPSVVAIVVCVVLLAAIAIWGIGESLLAAAAVTVIEIAGLLFVCAVAGDSLGRVGSEWRAMLPGFEAASVSGVVSGAFIAFYAYIGFEDMVNVAEEVRTPRRTLPVAIVLALLVSTALYLLVALVAAFALPPGELAGNPAPLAAIVASRGFPPAIIAAVSVFAVMNGALIQIIVASRVLYGLARQRLAPSLFARVHRRRRTPVIGTVLVASLILASSLFFAIDELARATSFIALSIFLIVNIALLRLKRVDHDQPEFTVPAFVPRAGAVLCVAMLAHEATGLLP